MDIERIKQNLRLRSGRTKKIRKVPKSESQSVVSPAARTTQYTQTDEERPPKQPNGDADASARPNKSNVVEQKPSPGSARDREGSERGQRKSLQRHDSGTGLSDTKQEQAQNKTQVQQTTREMPANNAQGERPQRQPLSRRSTARSDPASHKPTPQLLSSLMAGSSSSDSEDSSDNNDYDLRPPAPKPKPPSIESTSELLFSNGHLNTILYYQPLLARFTSFLHRYSPDDFPILMRYLETSKAIAAVEYANAVVRGAPGLPHEGDGELKNAASLDEAFQTSYNTSFEALLHRALPLYITYNLVRIVSECLENEITGKSSPMMRSLVGGLSEVFCLTDPKQPDNPIIYASEEFYRYTGYGRDDVIGHNCRFLQGPKTNRLSPSRLKSSLDKGEEVCETLLNYRRDGRPFINLLMIAPLHDDKGNVKYHIGAQVDVSGLVEGGRALEGFQRYLTKRENERQWDEHHATRYGNDEEAKKKQKTLAKLRDLSELFDLEESAVVVSHSRSNSTDREEETHSNGGKQKTNRKILAASDMSSDEEAVDMGEESRAWELGNAGPSGLSGKLPGVYEKYMLIRPAPSLRTIFVSPKLQAYGKLVQSPFLAHVAAPASTLKGLADSFRTGTPVSAKINFMSKRGKKREGTPITPGSWHEDGKNGRACWISATPLLGSDDQVGVWMVVFVERLKGRGRGEQYLNPSQGVFGRTLSESENQRMTKRASYRQQRRKSQDLPIKPVRIDSHGRGQALAGYRHVPAPSKDEPNPADEVFEDASPNGYQPYVVQPQDASGKSRLEDSGPHHSPSPASAKSNRRQLGIDDGDEGKPRASSTANDDGDEAVEEDASSPISEYLPVDVPPSRPSDAQSPASDGPNSKSPAKPAYPDADTMVDSGENTAHEDNVPESPKVISPEDDTTPADVEQGDGSPQTAQKKSKYMDYLSHPGGSRQISGQYAERGRSKFKAGVEGRQGLADLDCIQSPYSVD